MAVAAQAGTLLYQSDFTGTTVASAGLESSNTATGFWTIDTVNDRLKASFANGNSRATVKNTGGGFQSDDGITLEVTFNQLAATVDSFTIGLVDANASAWNNGNDFLNTAGQPYAIAFQTDGARENANSNVDVLMFHNGSTTSQLSDAQGSINFNEDTTLSLTITATGYSYSLNGAPATTGPGSFDMSKSYRFVAYGNDNDMANSYISNITLTGIDAETVFQMDFNDVDGNQSLVDRGTTSTTGSFTTAGAAYSTTVAPNNTGGYSGSFDGLSGAVDFGDIAALDGLTQMTITAWIKSDDLNGNRIVNKRDNPDGFDLYYHDSAPTGLEFVGDAGVSNGGGSFSASEWIWIAVTYDGTQTTNNVTFYTGDGTTLATGDTATLDKGALLANSNSLFIGNNNAGNRTFDGLIDNVRIYDTVKDAASLQTIMQYNDTANISGVLVWDGSTDSTWTSPDSTSWSGETYDDGDAASFAETGAGTVTLSGSVAPGSVAVDATADYTFTGDDISGATGLTKSGTGTLTLASANTYTGVTTIDGGILTVGHNAALGDVAGNTVVNGGSLSMEGGISLAEPLNITGGNKFGPALWNTAGNNTVTGAITGGGRIQTEAGTLTLSGGITYHSNAGMTGDLVVDTTPFSVTGGMKFSGDSYAIGDLEYVAGRTIVLNPVTGTHDWGYTRIWYSGIVELGANDIMPTDTDVLFGAGSVETSFAKLDLKSFDQTVASIEGDNNDVGGDVEITDSTGSGTLTVNQATDTEYQGRLTGGLALIKSGAGTLTLNNLSGTATSHTGATTVAAGTLSLLTDITASAMTVNSGASLELTLGTSVTSSALTLDGGSTVKVIGTPTLASYTLITASSISGTPVLDAAIAGYELVVNGLSIELNEVPAYTGWADGFLPGLTDSDPAIDFDGGSLETGVEYVLAGDPTDASDDLTVAPTSTYTGTALEFDYRRSDVANDDPSTTIEVEYGSDLSGWTTAQDGVADVSITVNDDFYGAGIDQVVVSLPDSLAAGKLFARLSVTTTP